MSTSELLRKSGVNSDESKRVQADEINFSAAEIARRKAKERQEKERARLSKTKLAKPEAVHGDQANEGKFSLLI
jgi:hypothetical protein